MPSNIPLREIPVLADVIGSAFPTPISLDLVLLSIDDTIFNFGGGVLDYPTIRLNTVVQYNAKYWIDKLLRAMLVARPDNGLLADFAWRHGVAYRPPGAAAEVASGSVGLERMLDPVRGFQDFGALLARLGAIANAICQISYPTDEGIMHGTGFLIGNETVLTNWHVVEHVIPANRKDVKLLFDFRTGGQEGGTVCKLVDDQSWLIDHSPYHAGDLVAEAMAQRLADTRPEDQLDYAVLRVEGAPGAQPMAVMGGPPRGFLALPSGTLASANFQANVAGLFIVQHPFDQATQKPLPLRYDWDKPAVHGSNGNSTRVLYGVNTRPGSSGSPCFNPKFELVALHHAGGMDWPANAQYLYNQGIPIDRIRKLLSDRGKLGEIT